MRERMARDKFADLFGVDRSQPQSEIDNSITKHVESARGVQDGRITNPTQGKPGEQFKKMYQDDATQGIFYKYARRVNDTYAEPSEDRRRVSAADLLIGRAPRSSPPKWFTIRGIIWEREDPEPQAPTEKKDG